MQITYKKTSRIAIVAIYCALLAIFIIFLSFFFTVFRVRPLSVYTIALSVLFSLAASLLGIVAIVEITIRRKDVKGFGYAVISIILALPIISFMGCSILVSLLRAEREKANMGTYNLRLLGKEIIEYTKANDGYLPVADKWCDLLVKHNSKLTKDNFRHPKAEEIGLKGECNFAFNSNLSGMLLADLSGDVVLIFEADGDWNLTGKEELLKTRYCEDGYITLLFANGKTADYWFYKSAIRKFNPKGTQMYYEEPSWNP
jgi:hypothetical protein